VCEKKLHLPNMKIIAKTVNLDTILEWNIVSVRSLEYHASLKKE